LGGYGGGVQLGSGGGWGKKSSVGLGARGFLGMNGPLRFGYGGGDDCAGGRGRGCVYAFALGHFCCVVELAMGRVTRSDRS
jgi:hypothetical protein